MEIINTEKMDQIVPIVPLCATDALKPPHTYEGGCEINLCSSFWINPKNPRP